MDRNLIKRNMNLSFNIPKLIIEVRAKLTWAPIKSIKSKKKKITFSSTQTWRDENTKTTILLELQCVGVSFLSSAVFNEKSLFMK